FIGESSLNPFPTLIFAQMRKSWKDSLRNYAGIQRAGAFVVTLLVILIFLPKDALFKFEYQLNQPWKHDKLLAPFDFGIKKSENELSTEQANLRSSQPLVFAFDRDITNDIISKSERQYSAALPDTLTRCDSSLQAAFETYAAVLELGILERSNNAAKKLNPFDEVLVYRNAQLNPMPLHQAITLQQVLDTIDSIGVSINDSFCSNIIVSSFKKNIRPNAMYSDSLTSKLLDAALGEIVEIEGKVEKGTSIIDRGDVVNDYRFKVLESLKAEYGERIISDTGFQWSIFGEMGIISALIGLLVLFIYMNQDRLFNDPRPMTLALSLLAISYAFSVLAISSDTISVYAIPIGITPLLMRMFYDFRVSIFTFIVSTLIIALFTANPLEYMVIQLAAISSATLFQASSTRRSRMLGTALIVFIGYSVIYVLMNVAQNGQIGNIDSGMFGWFAINSLLCMMVFPLIYIIEKVFGYISETTLLELSDSNQPLLKELAIKAPGTFQHSLQVANLCEKVANSIGGNAVLLRTAAMYHDVGKMNEPQFFIENQLPDNNPHDDLEPEESAYIIINHVLRGIEMCREHKIPFDIIQFIQTHHGTSSVRFFLKRAKEKAEQKGIEIDENQFSYPGPKPKTKEHAILMMADSVEAASRSLKKFDKESMDKLVDGLIEYQKNEGQFDNAAITLKDITAAKRALKIALHGIYHQRISYD
ncbi:HDIG domain-containing protein, partial [Salibacteraceae bacterium]|nr:HDIG domain-containing protein [Salibacteraceae bacterium]